MVWIRSLVFEALFYVVTALYLVIGSPVLFLQRRMAMAALNLHARTMVWLMRVICGTRVEVRGHENLPKGAAIIAAKHQSAWDTIGLIPLLYDPAMIMKQELMNIPLYGWFSRKFEMIPVRRDKHGPALRQMAREARTRADEGRHIVIFPEGTRRPPGAPPAYKPGVYLLYAELDIPCVPVALNTGLFWPRRSLIRRPGTIIVEFLPPIPPGLPRRKFMPLLEERIETACARLLPAGYTPEQVEAEAL